jgi:phage-related tail protein
MSKSYNTNAIKNIVSAFYSYNDIDSTYIFFVNNDKNIYIETLSGSIIIPYSDIKKYNRLNLFYIISLQLHQPKRKMRQDYYKNIILLFIFSIGCK